VTALSRDCISKKVIKNTRQFPKVLIQNPHEPIIDREIFDAVQEETTRRKAVAASTKKSARHASWVLRVENDQMVRRLHHAAPIIKAAPAEITEWNKSLIHQLVDEIRVLSADKIKVRFRSGTEIEQELGIREMIVWHIETLTSASELKGISSIPREALTGQETLHAKEMFAAKLYDSHSSVF